METEALDSDIQARSDQPADPAAADRLSSPDMDLQNPGTDFRRDAFELQQTDDVSAQEDSPQALVSAYQGRLTLCAMSHIHVACCEVLRSINLQECHLSH